MPRETYISIITLKQKYFLRKVSHLSRIALITTASSDKSGDFRLIFPAVTKTDLRALKKDEIIFYVDHNYSFKL